MVQRMLKEHCGERWGEAASKELRTYVPTIRKMVFSDYIYQVSNFTTSTTGTPCFGHIETPAKCRHQRESASVFKVFIKVQTKWHNC